MSGWKYDDLATSATLLFANKMSEPLQRSGEELNFARLEMQIFTIDLKRQKL